MASFESPQAASIIRNILICAMSYLNVPSSAVSFASLSFDKET
jgi:hypothetical protein